MSVGFTYFIPLILYIVSTNKTHLGAFVGLGLTTIISESLKPFFAKVSPRPIGAKDCNLLCNDGPQRGRPGMPSSHSATVVFFASFYYHETNNITIKATLIGYAISVMISRYVKKCHTVAQIIGGGLLGLSLSQVVNHLVRDL
jgi:membrane-associated phospholipid phosphatase